MWGFFSADFFYYISAAKPFSFPDRSRSGKENAEAKEARRKLETERKTQR
jgi:hypothetical protein